MNTYDTEADTLDQSVDYYNLMPGWSKNDYETNAWLMGHDWYDQEAELAD
jgi:hypothetical protein